MVSSMVENARVPEVQPELDELCGQISDYCGHRSVWIDPRGALWHAEPEELLEDLGYRYVGTFMRPNADELGAALARVRPVAQPRLAPSEAEPVLGYVPMPALA